MLQRALKGKGQEQSTVAAQRARYRSRTLCWGLARECVEPSLGQSFAVRRLLTSESALWHGVRLMMQMMSGEVSEELFDLTL